MYRPFGNSVVFAPFRGLLGALLNKMVTLNSCRRSPIFMQCIIDHTNDVLFTVARTLWLGCSEKASHKSLGNAKMVLCAATNDGRNGISLDGTQKFIGTSEVIN